jgi:hypothetical protein
MNLIEVLRIVCEDWLKCSCATHNSTRLLMTHCQSPGCAAPRTCSARGCKGGPVQRKALWLQTPAPSTAHASESHEKCWANRCSN